MTTYRPTIVDVAWMQRLVASLSIGGVWGYKDRPIVFKKLAERKMALIKAPTGDPDIQEQIERNQATMKEAGIEFVDARGDTRK